MAGLRSSQYAKRIYLVSIVRVSGDKGRVLYSGGLGVRGVRPGKFGGGGGA